MKAARERHQQGKDVNWGETSSRERDQQENDGSKRMTASR
jgi:hypothetical protein